MDLRELVSFLAMAEHRGIGKAAASLGLTQPALSQHLEHLERDLGDLFVRPGRPDSSHRRRRPLQPLVLTPAGMELRVRALRIVREVEDAQNAVQKFFYAYSPGFVRIAIERYFRHSVAVAIAALLQKSGTVRVSIEENNSTYAIDSLVYEGHAHLGLLMAADVEDRRIAFEQLGPAPLQLIVNKKHRLADARGSVDVSELAHERFVRPATGFAHSDFDKFFAKITGTIAPQVVVETDSEESVLEHVRVCPSLVTLLAGWQHREQRDLVFLDVPQPFRLRYAYLLWRGREPATEEARRVADAIRAQFRKGPPARSSGSAPRG
jgi:DNA-binding transcriptional LysR family regulator